MDETVDRPNLPTSNQLSDGQKTKTPNTQQKRSRNVNNSSETSHLLFAFGRDITYSYHVRRIPYADYRVNQIIPVMSERDFTENSHAAHQENRLFRKRYGVKIEFHQKGRLGKEQNF